MHLSFPFAAIAALSLSLSLAPTRASGASDRVFRAGAATSNITPPLGISISGLIGQRGNAKGIHDELHARCLVLDDGRTQVAIVVVDSTVVSRDVFESAKKQVQETIGFPVNRILASATHTHSTPQGVVITGSQEEKDYHVFLAGRIADGIRRAVNNLAPARIGWGSGRKPEYVFNRRSLIKPEGKLPNPFGETNDQIQLNPTVGNPHLIGPSAPVDPEVAILSVQHADGRPLALLANYGLHYVGGTGGGQVSADYFGEFAEQIKERLAPGRRHPPFVGIMSNGTSGNVNNVDFSQPRTGPQPPFERVRQVAEGVAAEVQRVWQTIEYHAWVPLAMEESDLDLVVRRPTAERLAWAQKIWSGASGKLPRDRREVYARETLEVAKYPATIPVKLQAIRIGTLGIAANPCEMFAQTGLEIKAQSPLAQTFTISLANGHNGYLPTPRDHELGGYETWLARSSYLEVQASEKIRDEILRLFKKTMAAKGD
jgi:hypothetical protein